MPDVDQTRIHNVKFAMDPNNANNVIVTVGWSEGNEKDGKYVIVNRHRKSVTGEGVINKLKSTMGGLGVIKEVEKVCLELIQMGADDGVIEHTVKEPLKL